METLRKPFQGISNIIRFNAHLYVSALAIAVLLATLGRVVPPEYRPYVCTLCIIVAGTTLISLLASWYIYDWSPLYRMAWLDEWQVASGSIIVNIHAGFDETSSLIRHKFPDTVLQVFDFYNPVTHTEPSIKLARKAYPPFPGTVQVSTRSLPLADRAASQVFVIFAAHEIRKGEERDDFFRELFRILQPGGRVIVTEHLRNWPNFLVYTLGCFHFLPRRAWLRNFVHSGFRLHQSIKITPFITTFVLKKNDAST